MRRSLKKGVSLGLVLAGRCVRIQGIPVLTYHSVDATGSVISVAEKAFEEQMRHLSREGYRTVSLRTVVSRLEDGSPGGGKEVVLTFDDGYKNNHATVFPILRRLGFTATIFLTPAFIGKTCGWQRDPSIGGLPLLSWGEIAEMDAAGMEFGAHTMKHVDLTAVSGREAKEEITASKKIIEDRLGKTVEFFCYPYGKYSEAVQEMVKDLGFLGACSLHYGVRNRLPDRYALKRIGTARFSSLLDFEAGILGTYGMYAGLRDLVKTA